MSLLAVGVQQMRAMWCASCPVRPLLTGAFRMFITFSWGRVESKRSTNEQLAFELRRRLSIWQFSRKRMFLTLEETAVRRGRATAGSIPTRHHLTTFPGGLWHLLRDNTEAALTFASLPLKPDTFVADRMFPLQLTACALYQDNTRRLV